MSRVLEFFELRLLRSAARLPGQTVRLTRKIHSDLECRNCRCSMAALLDDFFSLNFLIRFVSLFSSSKFLSLSPLIISVYFIHYVCFVMFALVCPIL